MSSDRVRIALDTNVLVYAAQHGDAPNDPRPRQARSLFARIAASPAVEAVVPAQVLLEFSKVLAVKMKVDAGVVVAELDRVASLFLVSPTDASVAREALTLSLGHGFQVFDAAVVVSSRQAGCVLLLSEDMQDRRRVGGLMIANPFLPSNAGLLDSYLVRPH